MTRMAPTLGDRIKGAAVRAARQLTDTPTDDDRVADPTAVDLDDEDGGIAAEVRIVADGRPPVFDTVTAVHDAVEAALVATGRRVASVTVVVVDTES